MSIGLLIRRSWVRRSLLLPFVLTMGLVASCGVPTDDSPRVIPESALPAELQASASGTAPNAFFHQIYMIGPDNKLDTVAREISRTPEGVMNSLLLGTETGERQDGIGTAITRNTGYSSIERFPEFLRLTVNLTEGSLAGLARDELERAFAQMVWSLTGLLEWAEVSFTVGGDPLGIPIDGGDSEPGAFLRRDQFASLDRTNRTFGLADEFDELGNASGDRSPIESGSVSGDSQPGTITLWLVGADGSLVETPRTVGLSPEAVLEALFAGPTPSEAEAGLSSQIKADDGATLVIPDIDESVGVAIVDLAPSALPVDDVARLQAVGQLVYSMTELAGVKAVKVSIAGEAISLPTDSGPSALDAALTRNDYSSLTEPDTAETDPPETDGPETDGTETDSTESESGDPNPQVTPDP